MERGRLGPRNLTLGAPDPFSLCEQRCLDALPGRAQRPFGRLFYTPYWTTFEFPAIDMKAASVSTLGQMVATQVVELSGKPGRVTPQRTSTIPQEPTAGMTNSSASPTR